MEQEPSYRPSSEAFAAYFAGEISSDEKAKIDQWVDKSSDNALELEQLRLVWQDIGSLHHKQVQVDLEYAFQQVKQKKDQLPASKSWSPVWRVAATILLLVTVSWWLWKPSSERTVFISQGVQEINLSDGSLVTLNDKAVLTYPEEFAKDERGLELRGEAFFSVQEDIERPFRIYAGPVTITVLGTEFSVKATDEFVEVSVASGRVEVYSDYVHESLVGGSYIHIDTEKEKYRSGDHSNSGAEYYWVNQQLNFEGLELIVVFAELESIFSAKIEVSDKTIYNCRLQASFDGKNLQEIMEIIALSQNLELTTNGSHYSLTGSGCDN